MEKVYEIEYESDVDYDLKIDYVDALNLIIYTITKKNDGHEYNVINGRKEDITDMKYPHIEVHFIMLKEVVITEDYESSYKSCSKDNMDEFYE